MTGRAATAASWPLTAGVAPERAGCSLVELIHQQAAVSPDVPAVSDGHDRWSYGDLWARTSSVATHLRRLGVGRGTTVGVSVARTNSAVAALLGVLVVGGAYVPFDPDYPPERLRAMSARVRLPVIVRNAGAPVPQLEQARVVDVDDLAPSSHPWSGPWPAPSDPAYVLFTSGSSGAPKGVRITHANLSAFLTWIRGALDPAELALVAATTSFNFDPSVIEVFATLVAGGAMRLLPNALALADQSVPVTLLSAPPSVIAELVRAGRYPPTARTLLMGGEALPPGLATDLLASRSVDRLLNCYGPTETTVMVTVEEVRLPLDGPVSIGRPIGENRVLVLDDDGQPVPDGEVGQLWIAGPQVADGYVGTEAHQTSGFAPVPFALAHPEALATRAYRTGDLASVRPDGRLDFHGRADEQLKIRGFRVEPGDVERALAAQPGVAQAAVVSAGSGGQARLVGYYVPTGAAPALTPADLRDALRLVLPPYLVPSELEAVTHLAVTPTGKLDRRSLADEAARRHAPGDPVGVPATGDTGGRGSPGPGRPRPARAGCDPAAGPAPGGRDPVTGRTDRPPRRLPRRPGWHVAGHGPPAQPPRRGARLPPVGGTAAGRHHPARVGGAGRHRAGGLARRRAALGQPHRHAPAAVPDPRLPRVGAALPPAGSVAGTRSTPGRHPRPRPGGRHHVTGDDRGTGPGGPWTGSEPSTPRGPTSWAATRPAGWSPTKPLAGCGPQARRSGPSC